MSIIVQFITIGIGILMMAAVVSKMQAKKLTESQAVGWLIASLVLIILGILPNLVKIIAQWFGIWYAPTMVALFAIVLLAFIVFYHTTELSKLTNQNNEIGMQVTLLKQENKELRQKLEALERGGEH